jgi:arylsulfatase A-like enzyme
MTPQTRRQFLRQAALGSATVALAAKLKANAMPTVTPKGLAQQPKRPNLLYLWTDQHRGDTVPWAGNRALKAPHFFTPLGEKSFVFQRTYIPQPVCTPSRASLMTGLWPHNHGCMVNNVPLRRDIRSIAEYLPTDYVRAYYGKWHLGDELKAQHGFTDWRSIEDEYIEYYSTPEEQNLRSTYHHFLLGKGYPPDANDPKSNAARFTRNFAAALPEPYSKTAYLADEAVRFLHERKDGQPFILSVNSLAPHPPSFSALNEHHDPDAMPAGPAFAKPLDASAPKIAQRQAEKTRRDGYKNHPIATEHDWRRLRANYYGMVSLVDNAYARILRALEESGQADNTIVIYTSDHGDMCGDHCLMQKGNFYEGSTHVPLAIHVPWLSRRRVDFDGPISTVDVVPTLLDLMGIDVAGQVDGRSRAELLRNPASARPENISVEWNDVEMKLYSGRSRVTADGWKLNLYEHDQPELYDLKADPGELTNRAADSGQADRIRRLTDELHAWQQQTRDTLPLRA